MAHSPSPNRRRHGRIRCELLRCALGDVVDISAEGLRIQGSGQCPVKVGQGMWLVLTHPDGQVRIRALARNFRRVGFRRYSLGMEFVGKSPEVHAALLHLVSITWRAAGAHYAPVR